MLIPQQHLEKWIETSKDLPDLLHKLNRFVAKEGNTTFPTPYAQGVDSERALVIYCTDELYKFVDKLDNMEDLNIATFGRLYFQLKPFLKEQRFKRV